MEIITGTAPVDTVWMPAAHPLTAVNRLHAAAYYKNGDKSRAQLVSLPTVRNFEISVVTVIHVKTFDLTK